MKLFLDCCCLNRLFDDQSQVRVHLEAEAVVKILESIEDRRHSLVGSSYLLTEVQRTPDPQRQQEILTTLRNHATITRSSGVLVDRARHLMTLGFHSFDALHIAAAESSLADWLLTTDDQMLKLASRHAILLSVKVSNPLDWSQNHLP